MREEEGAEGEGGGRKEAVGRREERWGAVGEGKRRTVGGEEGAKEVGETGGHLPGV